MHASRSASPVQPTNHASTNNHNHTHNSSTSHHGSSPSRSAPVSSPLAQGSRPPPRFPPTRSSTDPSSSINDGGHVQRSDPSKYSPSHSQSDTGHSTLRSSPNRMPTTPSSTGPPNIFRSEASSNFHSEDGHTTTPSTSLSSSTTLVPSDSRGVGTSGQAGSSAQTCSACRKPMTTQFVRAMGSMFHLECFRCQDCNSVVVSKFFPVDGPDGRQSPLCERDYFRRLDLLCSKCDQALRGSYITACNKKFHVEHFTCSVCPTLFGPQDSYYEHNQDVYCHYHYSTRFATKCIGCGSAILKQFVELNRNMKDECWHPECYMIHKFWNVRVSSRQSLNLDSTDQSPTASDTASLRYEDEEAIETSQTLKDKQKRMERQVYRIWTHLSAFEESSAACISDMLRYVSNGQYLEAIRMAEKFILHVEVLFAAIDELECHFIRANAKGMAHVREARMLCRKTVDLFTLLSHTGETGTTRRMGMTQELLSLVTGLAHYLKILIRITLTGALRFEREYGNRDAIIGFLDKLQALAIDGANPAARRLINGMDVSGSVLSSNPNARMSAATMGVRYGYRSLAPEIAGESPFLNSGGNSGMVPSDLCAACRKTVEEDCVRLGTYHRWHSGCVKCASCGKLAVPAPLPPMEKSKEKDQSTSAGGEDKEKEKDKSQTTRRPPANVHEFMFEREQEPDQRDGPIRPGGPLDKPPAVVLCIAHAHAGCKSGFAAVSRLEQYAFLLNVALRRLYQLLKKKGLMQAPIGGPAPPQETDDSRAMNAAYRDSSDIMRMKSSIQLDRKLSATARIPKRSTIVESPAGKSAQPTDVTMSNQSQLYQYQQSRGVARSEDSHPTTPASSTTAVSRLGKPQLKVNSNDSQSGHVMMDRSHENSPSSPTSSNTHVLRPQFARNNTQVYIVDDHAPTDTPDESVTEHPTLAEQGSSFQDDSLTLADIPQLLESEQAREQRRSLPRQGVKPLLAELSPLELHIVRHFALSALARGPLKDQFEVDDVLELLEVKNRGFWGKLFKGDKKNLKKKGVFGVPLELLVEREGADSSLGASRTPLRIPSFVDDVIAALKQMDMSVEGIFRKNGNIKRLKDIADALDRDPGSVDLTQDNPVQLAALFKKFLRDLPDPLLTFKLHRLFCASQTLPSEQERIHQLHLVYVLLPKYHRDTTEVLFVFLKWVASFSHVDEDTGSKMDLQNLATVICPNILYSKGRDPTRDESFTAIRVVHQLLELQDDYYTVPDEFVSVLHDQEYFANALEMQGKDLLKKCEMYRRVKQGSGPRPQAGPLPTSGSNGSMASQMSQRTDTSDHRLIRSQQSEPNIQRGRPAGLPTQNGGLNASSRGTPISHSQERPAMGNSHPSNEFPYAGGPSGVGGNMRLQMPHPGLAHQPFSHPVTLSGLPPTSPMASPLQQRAPDAPWAGPSRPLSYIRQSDEVTRNQGTLNGRHSPPR